jgi:hypothetical protein
MRNLAVFAEAMEALSVQLAAAATDRQATAGRSVGGSIQRWIAALAGRKEVDTDTARAMDALALRFDDRVRQTTNKLIALHGLSGRANDVILARLAAAFRVSDAADVGTSSAMGGVLAGALSGLTADLAAGGLTVGAGALIGGILGALGGAGVAHAYNVAKGRDQGSVVWSREWLRQRPKAALLRYLAVAHYGRGRGDWIEGEYPTHWQALVENLTGLHSAELERIWDAAEQGSGPEEVSRMLEPVISAMTREALIRLYPDAAGILSMPSADDQAAARLPHGA